MAYSYQTIRSDLSKLYRKISADVAQGFNFATDEIAEINGLDTEDTPYSPREVLFPIDLNEGVGAASIQEFGFEPNPTNSTVEDAQEDIIHLVGRFNLSKLAKFADKGNVNQVERNLRFQMTKKVQALRAWVGDAFYGFDDAVVAITDSNLSSQTPTLTLKDGYGRTDIDDAEFLARKFPIGEGVALVAAGSDALIDANAYGTVTARSLSGGTITLNLAASVTYSTDGIRIVKANVATAGQDVTITGTDLGKGMVGLLQANTAASLHGLTHTNWTAAYTDTTGGRFNAQRLRRMADNIADYGDGKMNMVCIDRGVYRDTVALQSAALRFSDAGALSMDGDITASGIKFFQSKRVPPGYVFGLDKSAMSKWFLLPIPGENKGVSWGDGKEYIDRSGMVFTMDVPGQFVFHNRKKLAYLSGLDRA